MLRSRAKETSMPPKVNFSNDSDKWVHVGPVAVPPYDSREVESEHLPNYKPEVVSVEQSPSAQNVFLADLSALSFAKLKAAIKDLSEADISTLTDLEQAKGDNARKSVLELLGAEILSRAANPADGEIPLVNKDEAEILAALPSLSTIDLVSLLEAEIAKGDSARPELVAAIGEEQVKRANAAALGASES